MSNGERIDLPFDSTSFNPLMNQPTSVLNAPETAQLLIDLESRQDQVLRELDELNARIEQAITFGQLGVRRAAASN